MNSVQAIPELLNAAKASFESRQPGSHTITYERAPHEKIAAELAALKQEPGIAQDLVGIIYPGAIPDDITFYDPLLQFALYLDFTDQANEIVGSVWAQALVRLNAAQAETVLLALPQVDESFSHGLSALPYLIERRQMTPPTMMQLGETLAKRTANDFSGPGLDRALETFAEKQPNEAMELLSTVTPTENNLGILGILLGRLRTGPHATSLAATVAQFEEKFRSGTGLLDRNVFYQSYYQEAFSGRLTVGELDKLCATADANGAADVHNLIVLLAIWMNTPRLNPPVLATNKQITPGWTVEKITLPEKRFSAIFVKDDARIETAGHLKCDACWNIVFDEAGHYLMARRLSGNDEMYSGFSGLGRQQSHRRLHFLRGRLHQIGKLVHNYYDIRQTGRDD